MQRISTWTVFKGEPVFFQAGSKGCSSCTPGTDVPSPLNAMQAKPLPWPGRGGGPPRAGCGAEGHGSLVPCLWFLGFPLRGDDSLLLPVGRCITARRIRREGGGKTARADSVTALLIPVHR